MMHVEPSFVLHALLLDPGCCLTAHTVPSGTVGPVQKKKEILPAQLTPAVLLEVYALF